jgi:predicted DNA-binding transcriptional regulator AlpA
MDDKSNPAVQFVTAKAVAKMLSLSTRTIWRLRSAGKLPQPVQIGGAIRWRLSDIEKHFEMQGGEK